MARLRLKRNQFFDYQDRAYQFAVDHPFCAWWIDMGLGKTAPALTVAADMLADFGASKVLVVAPKRVAKHTWPDEVNDWEHLKHLRVSDCTGGEKAGLAGLARDADIYTINTENIWWLVEHYKKNWPFDMVIIDESSRFKTPSAKCFRALKKLVKRGLIDRIIQLTGTPAPNGLLDVWAPMYLLDKGEALGSTFTGYRDTFFQADYMGYKYETRAGAEDRIYERISDKVLVIKGSNASEPVYNNVDIVLSQKNRDLYEQMAKDLIVELTDGDEIVAVNKAVLSNKLQQLASGQIYIQDEDTGDKHVRALHSEKLAALESIVEESGGKPLLVGYSFKHELAAIQRKFPHAATIDDGDDIIQRWNRGEIKMLVGHPASMGHGLNLQHGGHTAVWYGLTWSLELYQQFNKRLARTGQKEQVIIHHLVCKNTVDELILQVLKRKDVTQDALTNAVMSLVNDMLKAA